MRGLSVIFEILPVLSVIGDKTGSGNFKALIAHICASKHGSFLLFFDNFWLGYFRFKTEVDHPGAKGKSFFQF